MNPEFNSIKEITEKLLAIMQFDSQVEVQEEPSGLGRINILSPEAGFLIGQSGVNLLALQHLIKLIAMKKAVFQNFVLDVNDYQKHNLAILQELALSKAKQAIELKMPVILLPMPAFERRIIHLTLADYPGVVCQSEGENENRHIVIKPV